MFIPDVFLWKDLLKIFIPCKVAFYIDDIKPYDKAMASIRIRCYDIINYLNQRGIRAELYKPFKKYDDVIFTKTCTKQSVCVAKKLKEQGTGIYFESYCEYLEDDTVDNQEKKNILAMLSLADIVGVSSDVQRETFSKFHSNVKMIPESVHESFFMETKKHVEKKGVTLVYCGYSNKARDTLCIVDVIKRIQKERHCELLYICEKDPCINELEYRYLKYDQSRIPEQLMEGDIMIAPRPMDSIEKRGHSFTKAAYPLAVGLPVVASPMPSYLNSPVILCNTKEEWYEALLELSDNVGRRKTLGEEGRNFVKEHYSIDVIGGKYLEVLEELKKRG